MVAAVVSALANAALAVLVMSASALFTRKYSSGREHVAVAYALGGLGLVSLLTFFAYVASPRLGGLLSLVLLAGCIFYLGAMRAWRYWRLALPHIALAAGVLLVYLAILGFRQSSATDFYLVGQVTGVRTPDHLLPFLVSDRIANGASAHHFLDGWNGSDRPPLLPGLILFGRASITTFVGTQTAAFGASVVGEIIWVPAVFAFQRAIGSSRNAALLGTLLIGATGSTLVNTLYTWPKLMSAAFVLASCVMLVDARRRPSHFRLDIAVAVGLYAMAILSHGAAAFVLPMVVFLGLVAFRRQPWRTIVSSSAIAITAGLLLYLPWTLYQRFVDPPGDRLLKWHLAGVTDENDTRTFLQTLIDSYGHLSPSEWLSNKLANFAQAFDLRPINGAPCFCTDLLAARRSAEFFLTPAAIGIALLVILVVMAIVAVRLQRHQGARWEDRRFLIMVAIALACIVFWCLLMFIPSSTVVHQGSHVWIFLLILAPIGWIATRHPRVAASLVVVQFLVTAAVYLPRSGDVNYLSLVVALAGVAGIGISFALFRRAPIARRCLGAGQ